MGYVSELKQIAVKLIWIVAREPFKLNEVSYFTSEDQTTNTGTFEQPEAPSVVLFLELHNYSQEIHQEGPSVSVCNCLFYIRNFNQF